MGTKEFKKEIKEIVKLAEKHDDYINGVRQISKTLNKYFGYNDLVFHMTMLNSMHTQRGQFDYNLKTSFNQIKNVVLIDKRTDDIKVLLPAIILNLTFGIKEIFMDIFNDLTDEDGEIVFLEEEDEIRM